MKKVLIIPTTKVGYNGISNVILNQIKYMNNENYTFDIAISVGIDESVRKNLAMLGCEIYELPSRNKKTLKYLRELYKIIKKRNYSIVHVHGNSGTMTIELFAAKLANTRKIIAHGHSSSNKHKILHKFLKRPMSSLATHALACSEKAGEWTFSTNHDVILNGIDVDKFLYNQTVRNEYRSLFAFNNKDFVIGHIGHMTYMKNHNFLIDVFNEVYKVNNNAKLLLVGDGPDRKTIVEKINKLNLTKAVKLLGNRNDTNKILQAIDIFILPSLFEGFGIVNIEAQVSGVKCIVSDKVPIEVKVSNNIEFLSLEYSVKEWAKHILKYANGYERQNLKSTFINSDININNMIKKIEMIYEL